MRVHLAAFVAIALGAPSLAHAQAPTRIDDIQLGREGETVSILVKLSQQPTAASAKAVGEDFVIEIDGIDLAKLTLTPPPGSLVRHVEADGRKLSLSGAAFGQASTVIYRNAVLVKAKLAEPKLRGPSLMATTIDLTTAKPPHPPSSVTAPADAAHPKPVDDGPIDLVKRIDPRPAPAHPPESPATAKPKPSTTALASIDAARCEIAAADVEQDPWAIPSLGDHALCLIDQGKTKEAGSRLDQLAAFAPEDWRVALGRAALAAERGDASNAEIGYRNAASLAPSEAIRVAIKRKLDGANGDAP